MDTDAFSSFVSVDMDLQQPLLVIGLMSDVHYADAEDVMDPAKPRAFSAEPEEGGGPKAEPAKVDGPDVEPGITPSSELVDVTPSPSTEPVAATQSPSTEPIKTLSTEPVEAGVASSAQLTKVGVRRFRHSLEVLKRAVQFWRAKGGVSFVSFMGNAITTENAGAGAQWTALASYDEERQQLGSASWHLTPGVHDLRCFGSAQVRRPTADSHAVWNGEGRGVWSST
jgi:hypothetical protein